MCRIKPIAAVILLIIILASCLDNKTTGKQISVNTHPGKEIYHTKCGICHGGASKAAPNMSALKLLTASSIYTIMRSGVMYNQASTLTDQEKKDVAAFISEVSEEDARVLVTKGMCAENDVRDNPANKPTVSSWGMGLENHRYLDADDIKINAANVSGLKLDWAFAFPHATRARVQPTIVGNTLYTASQHGTIYALDKHTGCIRWTFQADAEVRSALVVGTDVDGNANRLFFGDFSAQVYALDLKTKKLLWKVKADEHAVATITGSLSVFENKLYVPISSTEIFSAYFPDYECCTFRGSVTAIDGNDGSIIWKTHTIKDPPTQQGTNRDGKPKYAPSGAPVWTSPTIDVKRRLIYIGTGENYTLPATPTSDAIIAMSLDDGEIKWVNQATAGDAWNGDCLREGPNCPEETGPDADFGAPPIIINYGKRDLVLAGQKSGMLYALDPDNNGTKVWELLVGRGGMMGGIHWGMATDGTTCYVPINDNDNAHYTLNTEKENAPGVHSVDVQTGKLNWSTIEVDRCGETNWSCGPGLTAPITLLPDLVIAGTLDGYMKAYHTESGKELWAYDTKRDYETVNDTKGYGGTIDSAGPVVDGDRIYVNSGYAKFNELTGNVLLSFKLE